MLAADATLAHFFRINAKNVYVKIKIKDNACSLEKEPILH